MALLFAEHSVTVYATSETPNATTKVVPVPTEAAGVSRSVQIEPIRSEVVVDARTGFELKNPYRMFVQPAQIADFPYDARVVWEDEDLSFRITREAQRRKGGGVLAELDHGIVEMEQMEMQA